MIKGLNGVGLCLRPRYFERFLSSPPALPWLEILADNFVHDEGIMRDKLRAITKHYPVILHCIGFGVGNLAPVDKDYCKKIKALADECNTLAISDHLCWTAINANHSHGLLPLPQTSLMAEHCARRIQDIKRALDYPFLLENIASYVASTDNELSEVDFINDVMRQADCGMLLDINNLYINANNHQFSAEAYLQKIDASRIQLYHMAGHQSQNNLLVDTHDQPPSDGVWSLFEKAIECIGPRATCLEWDAELPPWSLIETLNHRLNQSLSCTLQAVPC